jgi:flagellar motor switch protein FliM
MIASPSIQAFDARSVRGLSPVSRRAVDQWLRSGCVRATEVLTELGVKGSLSYEGMTSKLTSEALSTLHDPDFAAVFSVGKAGFKSVLSMRSRLLLAVVFGMLGAESAEWPQERAVSSVEQSLAELWLKRLGGEFSEAWPQRQPIAFQYQRSLARTCRARVFDPGLVLLMATLKLETSCGSDTLYWVAAVDDVEQMAAPDAPPPAPKPAATGKIADLAPLVAMPLSVELGQVQLSVIEAESLKCGDVLVLDQPVHGALTARVAGQAKYQGRPGRMGSRLCFAIDALVEG